MLPSGTWNSLSPMVMVTNFSNGRYRGPGLDIEEFYRKKRLPRRAAAIAFPLRKDLRGSSRRQRFMAANMLEEISEHLAPPTRPGNKSCEPARAGLVALIADSWSTI